jgi:hypothetical protein
MKVRNKFKGKAAKRNDVIRKEAVQRAVHQLAHTLPSRKKSSII